MEFETGAQAWAFEDNLYPNVGLNAVIGRAPEDWSMDPARFDEMRPGCWDMKARIADMDLAGIWASLCFPSLIAGFAGSVFSRSTDQSLGLACVRAFAQGLPFGGGLFPPNCSACAMLSASASVSSFASSALKT